MEARAERSTRVHWFGCGVRLPSPQGLASGGNSRGGEASMAAQPAMGGKSMQHDRRWFGRLEQQEQRLKKHYHRGMDIIRSLELESFILTKLTKPCIRVNSLIFEGTRQLSKATSVWQRTYSPFEICKNVQPIFEF